MLPLKFDMQHNHFQKRKKDLLTLPHGVEGVCYENMFTFMVLYAQFPLI